MKTVKSKMTFLFGILMTVICVGLAALSFDTSRRALMDKSKSFIEDLADQAAKSVDAKLSNYLNIMESLSFCEVFHGSKASKDYEKKISDILKKETTYGGYLHMAFANTEGEAIYEDGSNANLQAEEYFQKAIAGERVVTEPVLIGGKDLVMYYSVPVKEDNQVIGALIGIRDGYELGNLAGEAAHGKTGSAFILNSKGNTIAHSNKDLMLTIINSFSASSVASKDGVDGVSSATESAPPAINTGAAKEEDVTLGHNLMGYSNFTNLQAEMAEGKAGYGEYEFDGTKKVLGYAPIDSMSWSIGLEINRDEALQGINVLMRNIFIISSVFIVVALVIVFIASGKLSGPMEHLTEICYQMSTGDYSVEPEVKYTKRKDELGKLAQAFCAITTATKELLHKNRDISMQIADNSQKLDHMIQQFNKMMREISIAVDQIAKVNSEQAENTQVGAQRMAEMESLIEQGQRNMLGLHDSSNQVEQLKEEGFVILTDLVKKTEASRLLTKEINYEINETNKSAAKISDISFKIGDITKQTKLLALNASIEAARAGEHGKGFAIVAKDVEVLTELTSKLSKEINGIVEELSERALASMTKMNEVEKTTAEQAKSVEMTQAKFIGIAQAIEDTRSHIDTLNVSIDKMSNEKNNVVTIISSLSASSEENASGTEEVSASVYEQANYLEQIAKMSTQLSQMSEELEKNIQKYKF